jgi:hypothetical protein
MFWKKNLHQGKNIADNFNAGDIVSKIAGIFADFNEKDQLVKPQSSLPCSWFASRECFMIAYNSEYAELSEELRHSYHFIYRELAFFIEDDLYDAFNVSLNIAVACRIKKLRAMGLSGLSLDEDFCRRRIATGSVKIQRREEILKHLSQEETCPKQHLLLLAEILTYCSELHRAMWDEWVAFSNMVAYRKSIKSQ